MADYNLQQIVYTEGTCLSLILDASSAINVSGAKSPSVIQENPASPYQQIVLNSESIDFQTGRPYYLEVDIPQNSLYNMDFGLHLIGSKGGDAGEDLDMQNYQFIRYLNIPKSGTGEENISRVVLYEEMKTNPVSGEQYFTGEPNDVIIVKEIKTAQEESEYVPTGDENRIVYFETNNKIGYYKYNDDSHQWESMEGKWGINDTLLTHSWFINSDDDENSIVHYDIIFTPRTDNLHYLYLYLIPIIADSDIVWTDSTDKKVYYGRHLDVSKIKTKLYAMNNLLNGITVKRFGLWGHSELMFTVNGEELKVGPSGYYELRDFDTKFLSVAAQGPQDKFTIDIQW